MHQPKYAVYYQVVSINFEEYQDQSSCIVSLASQVVSGEVRILLEDLIEHVCWKKQLLSEDYLRLQALYALCRAH